MPQPRLGRWRGRQAWPLLLAGVLLAGRLPTVLPALITATHADDDDDDAANMVQAPSRVRVRNGQTELLLSRAAERNAGIALGRPQPLAASSSVQGYGEVLDATALIDLASRYRASVAQMAAASARSEASQSALKRVRSLYQDRQNMSKAQLQGAQSAAATDQSALHAAQAALAALTATLTQEWGPVLAAAVIDDGPLLRELVSRRQYLVAVTLPPGIVPATAPRDAEATLPDGHVLELRFVSAGTTADPAVQGLRYDYRAAAARGLLPGLHLPVSLAIAGSATDQVVPESAVVWLQGKPWIYRLLAAATAPADPASRGRQIFARELIAPVRQAADGGYVVSGLPGDARIVVRGAQLLLSEEFRAQVQTQDND